MGRIWQRRQQPFRIRMGGMIENIFYPARFYDDAGIHDIDTPAHLGNDTEIVGNEDDGHLMFRLQFFQELEDLGFRRHIESRRRFIGKQQAGFTG